MYRLDLLIGFIAAIVCLYSLIVPLCGHLTIRSHNHKSKNVLRLNPD
jgi:hypothetical protein